MSTTDFFDDDLVRRREKGAASGSDVVSRSATGRDDIPARPVTDLNLTRMAKRKEELSAQASTAMNEIERLRRRQEELEREKQSLGDMVRRQDEYERGKREMIDSLEQSITIFEKHEVQAARLTELYAGTRQRFKELLQEIQTIDDGQWADEGIREELNKAVVLIDDARKEYHRSLATIEAAAGPQGAPGPSAPIILQGAGREAESRPGFAYWIKVGVALTIPLAAALIVAAIVHAVLTQVR